MIKISFSRSVGRSGDLIKFMKMHKNILESHRYKFMKMHKNLIESHKKQQLKTMKNDEKRAKNDENPQ